MKYRICTKCGKEFPATLEFFHKMKAGKFGLHAKCKICNAEYQKNNKEKRVAVTKKYRKANKDKCMAAVKKWRRNNREGNAAVQKKWREDNKEKCAVYMAKWWKDNPDKHSVYNAKREAKKRNQTPRLTETEKYQIELIYKKSQELGPDWHVDHIIPVSKGGLFHPDNLQIVIKEYNLQKGSKLNFRLPNKEEIFNWHEGFSLMNTDVKEKLEHEI